MLQIRLLCHFAGREKYSRVLRLSKMGKDEGKQAGRRNILD
jgi:hypothetical protein